MRNNIQTIPGRFGSKPSLFRIVRVGDDNEISESYRGLREEKDGDGDGLVNDGKPSERPVNDSDKPKKDASTKKFKTGAEHGFSEMLGPTKRGVKTIGPVDIKGFRVGDTKRPGKKVVHFGGTEQDVKSYQSLHRNAGSTNTEIKQYDISFKNAVLAGHQNDLTRAWFGKPYGEMMDTYQHKYGAKFGASYATAKFDEKLAAEAKKRGHSSVIIVTDPYHCYRAVTMAEDLDFSASCAPVTKGAASLANSGLKYLSRETGAYLAYKTLGQLGINLSDHLMPISQYP